jgi:RHS repeat-associated protein
MKIQCKHSRNAPMLQNSILWQGADCTIAQETHNYPFGMLERSGNPVIMGRSLSTQPINLGTDRNNANLYNGKELNDDMGLNWYDYGARFYDAQIGRWHSVDPLAEHPKQISKSPYAAMWNNPIRYNDPDGRCPECFRDVEEPVEGHIYTSSGDETYVYGNGDWTRQGGDLSEVVVTHEATESQTTATISDLEKGLVEGFLDPLVFTTTSVLSGIGNTALGVNKK